jgi:hypothetical protein
VHEEHVLMSYFRGVEATKADILRDF